MDGNGDLEASDKAESNNQPGMLAIINTNSNIDEKHNEKKNELYLLPNL